MHKRWGLLIATLMIGYLSSAQLSLNYNLYSVVPPSPDASSLGKYGAIPVSYSTGVPQISVPIYTIPTHGLKIPISISYHAGGVKVEEMASWVGLGWALNAGGVITRSMAGLPDEGAFGYLSEPFDIANIPGMSVDSQALISSELTENQLDIQPDDYYFNFMDKSGRFFMDQQGNIKIIPLNLNLKINRIMAGTIFQGWQITDEEGNSYYFRVGETTKVVNSLTTRSSIPPIPEYTSSWYLDQIVTAMNDTVVFNYQRYSQSYYTRQMSSKFYLTASADGSSCIPSGGGGTENYNFTQITITGQRISEIDFRGGKVVFTPTDTTRTDIPGDFALHSVSVYNTNNDLIRRNSFFYSYFNSNSLMPSSLPPSYTTTRLRLDSLLLDTTMTPLTYRFGYNGRNLPNIFSMAQDHWGYYNGVNNLSLIPLAISGGQTTNRAIDTAAAKTGILNSITYPTGGSTTFFYEGNTATMAAADYNAFLLAYGGASQDLVSYGATVASDSAGINQNHFHSDLLYVDPATVPFDEIGDNFRITAWTSNSNSCPLPSKLCTGSLDVQLSCVSNPSVPTIDHVESLCTYVDGKGTGVVKLDTGETYALTYILGDHFSSVGLVGQKVVLPSDSGFVTTPAGGLRILRTVNTPGIGLPTTKEYYYTSNLMHDPSLPDTVLESGTLNGFPHYEYNADYSLTQAGPEGNLFTNQCTYEVMSSGSLAPLESGGSAVNYKVVQENDVSGALKLKSVYTFTTAADAGAADVINYAYPYTLIVSNAYRRGLPLTETQYAWANDNYTPQLTKSYEYQFLRDTAINGVNMACNGQVIDNSGILTNACYTTNFIGYSKTSQWLSKITERTVQYDQLNDSAVRVTSFFYDNPLHQYPTRTQTTDSKGDTVTTFLQYPLDFAGLTGGTSLTRGWMNLQTRNVVSPVVEKYIQLKNADGSNARVIGAMLTSYSPTVVSPDTVWATELAAPTQSFAAAGVAGGQVVKSSLYASQMMVDKYDAYGNIVQQNKVNDINVSYIWDYAPLYPIAEVKNADSASVAYTSFEADGSGNWVVGTGSVDATTSITGSNSFNLTGNIVRTGLNSGTTYIVSYWTTNASPFSISGTISGFPVKGKTEFIHNANWTLYIHKITGQTTITVSGSGHIDELRLYPATAQMTTMTYSPLVGMTSQTDIGNRVTYYEYDWLQRLKRIRDQDYNIIKSFDYIYQTPGGCGSNCSILAMQTFLGTNTAGYPVGIFNVHGKLIGNASGASGYVSLWNSDTADSRIGTLAVGPDSLHFTLSVDSGQTAPASVTGCRYYQYDLPWNKLDGITQANGTYVNFGDGTGMHLPLTDSIGDTTQYQLAPNTTRLGFFNQFNGTYWFIHNYTDTSLKTITLYHNEVASYVGLDNGTNPATSLTKVQNLRGNFPQSVQQIGGSCYQQASALTVSNIYNWSTISSVTGFWAHCGDHVNPSLNLNYAQDFMANNRNLQVINTTQLALYQSGYWDSTFKLTRLKSDWNTYFTSLQDIEICDAHWNREDLTALTHLSTFDLVPDNQNHSNDSTGNPVIPIPASAIDAILNQIASGAGQNVSNGVIWILTGGGTGRTSASSTAVGKLDAKGWLIYIDNVQQ